MTNSDSTERHAELLAELNDRLNGHDKSKKLINKKHERLERLVASVGERLAQTHDMVVAELTPRLAKLEEQVAKGLSLNFAAQINGFTKEEIQEILAIQAEDDLSDSAVISGMISAIDALKAQMNAVVDTVASHSQRLDRHRADINRALDNSVDIDNSSVDSWLSASWGTAAVVGVVAWIVAWVSFVLFGFWPDGWEQYPGWSATVVAFAAIFVTAGFTSRVESRLHLQRLQRQQQAPEPAPAPVPDNTAELTRVPYPQD